MTAGRAAVAAPPHPPAPGVLPAPVPPLVLGPPALAALAALTALRLLVAVVTPLSPDEAYYWVWSRALAPGYLDHPPMVALWIRLGTALAGDGALGVRLLGPVAAALGTLLLARAAADLVPGPAGAGAGLRAAVLLNATLFLGAGSVTMTPDTPLLLFWTAVIAALARLLRTGDARWWLAAGAAAGLALDSKYTAVLLAPALLVWLLAVPSLRPALRRPYVWAAALLALALFAPVLWWNAAHGWASFIRQGGRAGDWRPARAAQFLGELLGSQAGLVTPLVFALCVAGTWAALRRAWRTADAAPALLAALVLVPGAVFVQHAFGDRVQGNWPAVLYPAAAIAAAMLPGRFWRPAAALGFGMTLVVYLQAATGIVPVPPKLDPTLLQLAGWPGLARAVAEAAPDAAFIAADEYGAAALLARDLPGDRPVLGVEPRWRFFALPPAAPALAGRTGVLVRTERRTNAPDAAPWSALARIGTVARARDGVVAERYALYRVTLRADAPDAVILPRPEGR